MTTKRHTVTTGFQHELYFDSIDRAKADIAWEYLRGAINQIQGQRIAGGNSLEMFLTPRISRNGHSAAITFITREDFTPEEQRFIRLRTSAKEPRFNIPVEVTLEEVYH